LFSVPREGFGVEAWGVSRGGPRLWGVKWGPALCVRCRWFDSVRVFGAFGWQVDTNSLFLPWPREWGWQEWWDSL